MGAIGSGGYIYSVSHPEHGTVEVLADDRLHALVTACNQWGVRWPAVARACTIQIIGKSPGKRPSRQHNVQ